MRKPSKPVAPRYKATAGLYPVTAIVVPSTSGGLAYPKVDGLAHCEVVHLDVALLGRVGSAVDHDIWAQVQSIILTKLPVQASGELGPWFGTVGDPKLRLRPRDIKKFSPHLVRSRWRKAITELHKINPNLLGVCVVELQLCRSLDRPAVGEPRYFYEPHLHFVIFGVSEVQVKAAFKVRIDPKTVVRKRSMKVQSVYDLSGLIGYLTKARPDFRKQYRKSDGTTGWGRSRIPLRYRLKWHKVMSKLSINDLLTSTGISLRSGVKPKVAELAPTSKRIVPHYHRGGC